VFLVPIERAMGWSRRRDLDGRAAQLGLMGLGSFCWGALPTASAGAASRSQRLPARLGLVLASQGRRCGSFYLSFGVLVGFAVGAFYAPLTATTTRWFTVRRGLAVALVSAGIGLGILIHRAARPRLTSAWDWRVACSCSATWRGSSSSPSPSWLREPDDTA